MRTIRGLHRSTHPIQNHTSRTGRETHLGGRTRPWVRPNAFHGYACIQQPTWTRRFRKMLPTLGCSIGYNSQFPGATMGIELASQVNRDVWGGSQMIFPDVCHKPWQPWCLTHLKLGTEQRTSANYLARRFAVASHPIHGATCKKELPQANFQRFRATGMQAPLNI